MRHIQGLVPMGAVVLLSACAPIGMAPAPMPATATPAYSRLLPMLEAEGFEVDRVEAGGPVVVVPAGCLPKPRTQSLVAQRQNAVSFLQNIDREAAAAALSGQRAQVKTIISTESCNPRAPTGPAPQ